MLIYYVCLFLCSTISTVTSQQNGVDFERMDAFHSLGKCSHSNCGSENQEFTSIVEKSEDLKGKFERCSKCRTKPYEELNTEEKKMLIECIKANDCDNSNEFYQKYKDKEEFQKLIKCLESKCSEEYKIIQKYVTKPTTDLPAVTPAA